MAKQDPLKSTNVRLVMTLTAIAACSGCVTATAQLAGARPCEGRGPLVCERFGSERRCECGAPDEVSRLMSSFGEPSWLGGSR